MRRTKLFLFVTLLGLDLSAAYPANQAKDDRSEVALQAAIKKETIDGDLKGAIEQYKKVAQSGNRAVAAMALVHMAGCYQKMGDAEARTVYERVLRDYADQKEAAAMARVRLGGSMPARNAGIVTRQVWTGPKVDISGAVSPDGRVVSLTDWSTGDLALHDLATGQDGHLTNKGTWTDSPEYAYGSVFSPDGKQLAYGWTVSAVLGNTESFEVRLIDRNGGKPRVLFANRDVGWIDLHDWSPDGRWLAVGLARVDRTAQIGLISTADGTLRALKSVDWRGASKMAFSPDGRYLAYDLPANDDSEQRDIYVMAVDGSRETPAAVHPANDLVVGWSPDGKHLLFASDRSGSNGIWALPVADGRPHGSPALIKADLNPSHPTLTRSGTLYYSVLTGGSNVYVASVNLETGKVLSPPVMIETPYVGFNGYPQWSPDCKYLAYLSRKDPNSNSQALTALVIRSMETGKSRELRPNLRFLYSRRPVWSSDGSFLVAAGGDTKGRQGIYRIDAQSGEAAPLVLREQGQSVLFAQGLSPDGKTLYLSKPAGKRPVLLAHDLQSGKERELARGDSLRDSAVSPDGRYIAVAAVDNSTKSGSLLLVPAEGGEPRELLRVSHPETIGTFVAWLPDGKHLLFRKGPDAARETFRIAVGGGAPAKYGAEWTVGPPSICPDGRRVAFMSTPRMAMSEIWTLENFLPALTARK